MEEESEKQFINDLNKEIIITHTLTASRLLGKGKAGVDAFTLYNFYCYCASRQETNKVYATDQFCTKGLHWGRTKFRRAKNLLLKEKIIETVIRHEKGRIRGHYVYIHYITRGIENNPVVKQQGGIQTINAYDININTSDKKSNNSDLKIAPKVKRKDFRVKPEVYKEITDAYEKYKGIKLQGAEYGEVKRAIKTMLYSGRTKQNIIDFMKFCSEIDDDDKDLEWLKNWTLLTIKRKMPEFLAGKIKKKVDGEEEENYKVKFYGHTFEN